MLTSFFSKSKPFNLTIIILLMCGFYISINFFSWDDGFDLLELLEKIGTLVTFILSLLILNFIAKKNELTKRSAFKTLLFAVFAISFMGLLTNEAVIISNLFVLLALRRIISLRSHKFVKMKIFDATFWICIASLYHFWSILFLLVVFFAILSFAANGKNWLIPPVAFGAVASLTITFHLVVYEQLYLLSDWYQTSDFDFSPYGDLRLLVPLSVILGLLVWTLFHYFISIQKASISKRPTLNLILVTLLIAGAVGVFSPTKNGAELIFFFVPLSIIASNYFDNKKDKIFKDVLLVFLILMPFLVVMIN